MLEFEQIRQEIDELPEEAQDLLIDFIQLLKKRYPQPETESQKWEKSLYERFDKIGLIGCCSTEENLSTNYKEVLADLLEAKYDHS